MVSITDIRVSNESLKRGHSRLVAVFAGATAGIGLNSLKQLAKHANAPRVYMIGRSKKPGSYLTNSEPSTRKEHLSSLKENFHS
jgi:hypothetical protein